MIFILTQRENRTVTSDYSSFTTSYTTAMRYANEPPPAPRRVRVPGRDDLGIVIQAGKNLGTSPNIYCAIVHFPETGEVAFYDMRRLEDVEG
jgi:hypothetical protein